MDNEIEEWTCPICLDLAYKPVVNPCGHTFCFWCLHRCMNFPTFRDEEHLWAENQCPNCRGELLRLPAVCVALHHYLQQTFPADYSRREAFIGADEDRRNVHSLAIERLPSPNEPKDFCRNIFACSTCGEVGSDTLVLTCGHLICRPACQLHRCKACSARITGPPSSCPKMRQVICKELPEASSVGKSAHGIDASVMAAIEDTAAEGQQPPPSPIGMVASNLQHYGVGCDGCGILPILGKRYKCLDCPEAMGFDLCAACHAHGLDFSQIRGRFNQQHDSSHRMQLMQPAATLSIYQDREYVLIDGNWVSGSAQEEEESDEDAVESEEDTDSDEDSEADEEESSLSDEDSDASEEDSEVSDEALQTLQSGLSELSAVDTGDVVVEENAASEVAAAEARAGKEETDEDEESLSELFDYLER